MSLTGSLMTYDNNNDLLNTSQEKMLKKATTVTQGAGQKQPLVAVSTQTGSSKGRKKTGGCCGRRHLNSLWSLWYGMLATIAQVYIIMQEMRKFLGYWMLEWRGLNGVGIVDPPMEVCGGLIALCIAGLLLAPFLTSAVFRAGNLPNDGRKLGSQLSTCTAGPPIPPHREPNPKNHGVLRSLWQHGGPTAPFLHLVMAFLLLLPKVMMEARLIEGGFLPQETVWRTDLDFLIISKDRMVISSFMTSSNNASTLPTPLPMVTLLPSANRPTKPTLKPTSKNTETATILPPKRNSVSKTQSKPSNATSKPPIVNTTKTQNVTKLEPKTLPFSMEKTLIEIFGIEPYDPTESNGWNGPVSLEFLNYGIALIVYAVRYPAVFWGTNKCFGLIFSFQLLVNGIQSLISFAGMSVLYKVQVIGADKTLPLLRHIKLNMLGGETPFLLNPLVTVALYILSEILVLSSSLVLYLYGYGKFNAFLHNEREKKVIMIREGRAASGWGYFTHCAALCVLLAIAVCCAPLLHDYTVVYRGSLDGTALACVISTIFHLFLWVLVWLFLTLKQKWVFKVRVTIGRAAVRSARSIKLVTDVDLLSSQRDDDLSSQPLLIVGNGRTYTISENSPKKAIMTTIQRAAIERKAKSSTSGGSDDDGEEQIYWLRPKTMTLNPSDSTDKLTWFNKKITATSTTNGKPTQKVTFNDVPCTSNNRNKERGASLRIGEGDDGDYATLKELPLGSAVMLDPGDDTSEEGKLLACVRDDSVTYACTNRDLVPPCDYEDPSPLLTPEALPDPPTEPNSQLSPVTTSSAVTVHTSECQSNGGLTPRCLRRADSGVPGEETVRSGSGSSGSSPPDPPGSSTSDSSSGVHSAASMPAQRPRANSLDDFVLDHIPKEEAKMKSFSLQRGVLPPSITAFTSMEANSVYGFAGVQYTTVLHPNMNGHSIENNTTAIIENGSDNTLIIRRKNAQPIAKSIIPQPVISEEPFGRSTNMKMTTFANSRESLRNIVASSATLPHYPTQPVDNSVTTPQCSTMPLNIEARGIMLPSMVSGSSCQSFARPHCTLPNHQGGLRIVGAIPAIRRPPARPRAAPSHHSFPVHLLGPSNFGGQQNQNLHCSERDSANFSMASSGDSDNNMYISVNRA